MDESELSAGEWAQPHELSGLVHFGEPTESLFRGEQADEQ
jgi:hypothetical protein